MPLFCMANNQIIKGLAVMFLISIIDNQTSEQLDHHNSVFTYNLCHHDVEYDACRR